LGHAARCIPIIRYLISEGHKISVAADQDALELLKNTFESQIDTYSFPQTKIKYGKSKFSTQLRLIINAFSYFYYYKKEKNNSVSLLNKIGNIDLIISDNRYACYSNTIPSIIISHQISLKLPALLQVFSFIPNYFILKRIKRFNELWIPDIEDEKRNLSGKLSHPKPKKINVKYIGILSRFSKTTSQKKEKQITVILSGPEPQKSIFEKHIINELNKLHQYSIIIIGGGKAWENKNIKSIKLKNSMEIEPYLTEAEIVISRAGYTSIMDYIKTQKRAIMIPTLGQTEQEYLAKHLTSFPQFVFQKQNKINLKLGLKKLEERKRVFQTMENSFVKEIEKYLI
jgi:uncharacterized protein (TIGR00661 family)